MEEKITNFTIKSLRVAIESISGLEIQEAFRYPVFLFLTLLTGFVSVLLLSDFLSEKFKYFSMLSEMKKSFYSSKWIVITLSVSLAIVSLLAIGLPAGLTSRVFFGDLFAWMAGLTASTILFIDVMFNCEDDDVVKDGEDYSSKNKLSIFLNSYSWIFGIATFIITFLHLVAGTALFL